MTAGRHPRGLGRSWGDDVMALGQAQAHHRATGRAVCIVDQGGQPRWSEIWEGQEGVVRTPGPEVDSLVNAPGARPYLVYPWTRESGVTFSGWRAAEQRATLRLSEEESAVAKVLRARLPRLVILEPNLALESNPNKQWGWARWQALALALLERGYHVAQVGPARTALLRGAILIETGSFRHACVALAGALTAVLPEGGLHHAAAALDVPAVVIFGGHTPTSVTGYPGHVNLAGADEACGSWRPCAHCDAAMARITVEEVLHAVATIRARLDLAAGGAAEPLAAGLSGGDGDAATEGVRPRRRRGRRRKVADAGGSAGGEP